MDAESSNRHSAASSSTSTSQPGRFVPFARESFGRPHPERSSGMSTASLVSPGSSYPSHPPPGYASSYHSGPSSGPGGPGMLSPADSRRTSDEHDSKQRQSLPSIQEVIGQKSSSFHSSNGAPSLPSPFSSSAGPRPLTESGHDGQPSPRTMQPAPTFPRPDSMPAFSDPARSALSGRPPPPPPLNTFHGPHASQSVKGESHEAHANGSFPHPPQFSQVSYQSSHLPPGQLPLSAYALSPRQPGPPLPSPYDSQRSFGDDSESSSGRGRYETTVNRHFEAWNYAECIAKIGSASRTILNFSEAYLSVAREEHGNMPISNRLPSEREVTEMAKTAEWLKNLMDNMRTFTQQNALHDQAREGSRGGPTEDDDVSMQGDGQRSVYGLSDVKKRRGRAAPPGRCHSCNRIDTPEWRRGPDGARTLCNACGLHYAKLERKRLNEQRSIRPKPPGERS